MQNALGEVVKGIESEHKNMDKNLSRFRNELRAKQDAEKNREDRLKRQ